MDGVIDFFESAKPTYEFGQIWCDQPIYLPPKHGVKFTRVNQKDDRDFDFQLTGRTDDTFDHPPINSLKLESTEAAVLARTKWERPVIIVGGSGASTVTPRESPTHHDILWTVPVYGSDQYSEDVVRRIRMYDFKNLFYLPPSGSPAFKEGFARLDHAQPVMRGHLRKHRGLKLTDDALAALHEWLVAFSTGRIEEDSLILQYRAEQTAPSLDA
jgi:hypothetical protein